MVAPLPIPTVAATDKLTWMHSDKRTLATAIDAGVARALHGPWTDDEASTADLRAFLFGVCVTMADLGPTHPAMVNGVGTVTIAGATRTDDLDWQTALGKGIGALAQGSANFSGSVTYETTDGTPGTKPLNASSWGLLIAVGGVVACYGIMAHYLAQIVSQENEIAATKLAVDANQQQLAGSMASALQAVQAHKDAEAKAGATIPYDAQENHLLDTLNAAIEKSAGWKPPPLKSIPDPDIIPKGIAGAADKVGDAVMILAALVGVGFLLK